MKKLLVFLALAALVATPAMAGTQKLEKGTTPQHAIKHVATKHQKKQLAKHEKKQAKKKLAKHNAKKHKVAV